MRFLIPLIALAVVSACSPGPYAGAPATNEPIIMPEPTPDEAIERAPVPCETAHGGDDGIGGTGCSID